MDRKDWDRLAPEFENSVYDIAAIDRNGVIGGLVERIRPRRTRDVLVDLGCGIGTFVKAYGARFASVVALDFSAAMIERARERCADVPNVTWITDDIVKAGETLTARADLTVCLNVITTTRGAKREAIWDTVAAVTKPDRHAIVVVPALESAEMVAALADDVTIHREHGLVEVDGEKQKYYTREELAATVERHGMTAEEIAPVAYPWAEEVTDAPRGVNRSPFDWVVLARRSATG